MWTLHDAKNRFSSVVDAAMAGAPQEVSRRGRPAVVVISAEAYRALLADAVSRRESFADHLLAFPGLDEGPRAEAAARDVTF